MTATVAGWIAYAGERGTTIADDQASAEALIRGTDYITYHYVGRFASGYTIDSPNVDEAIYEAAALELATPGFFAKTFTPADRKVLVQVDSIRWQPVGGGQTGVIGSTPVSTKIEAMLGQYLRPLFGAYAV